MEWRRAFSIWPSGGGTCCSGCGGMPAGAGVRSSTSCTREWSRDRGTRPGGGGDPFLNELYEELLSYPGHEPGRGEPIDEPGVESAADVVLPMRVRMAGRELSFLSTTTVFGSPLDVTVAELAIESFYPADAATAAAVRALAPLGAAAQNA